jgi:phosphoribosylamine--glycine ligase
MKVLLIDMDGGDGLDFALRAQEADHAVRYCVHGAVGDGLVDKVDDWEAQMDWAELIIPTKNSKYQERLAPYFGKGYPIFGANAKGAELELDREVGQKILRSSGVPTLPYHTVKDIDEAIAVVLKTGKAYAIKPWGGTSDKSLTCVAKDTNEAIFMLTRWKADGLDGQLMLQEKADGVEMGIAGWFGPGGWSAAIEESFEHKKFLVGDLGCNTGEMGTVIRHVRKSKLFTDVLEPVTEYLHSINYVGDCSVNCIIDDDGVWPLEFTCRLGWPDFAIRQAVIQSDPVEWMADLLYGKDTLDVSTDIVVGVLLTHGNFPVEGEDDLWSGHPIEGITEDNRANLHFQQVKSGKVPRAIGGKIKERTVEVTAGNYIMVVTGTGETVSEAQKAAYDTVREISLPSNLGYRTDIGDRLAGDLKKLHENGYAKGMQY